MVAINFMGWKAPVVEDGSCRQTIRENTKARAGCELQLYYGLRTKACRKLRDARCVSVQPVILMKTVVQPFGGVALIGIYLEEFAKADGFKTYVDMWAFFEGRADKNGEFNGFLIKW